MPKTSREKVCAIFQKSTGREDFLKKLTEGIIDSWKATELKFRRMFTMVIFFLALFYLIACGLVVEGTVGGLKISKIKSLLISAPVLIGAVSYLMLNSLSMVSYYKDVISECYKYLGIRRHKKKVFICFLAPRRSLLLRLFSGMNQNIKYYQICMKYGFL